ncbi:hypothetical protein [Ferdinandcohnia sp. SAFN-114]|uniref:hypothetical protein n=1 Tax=Ferdinandcohnia sp. SAFN-114 TaxID=3387275 RepID=UPI003F8162BE
MNSIIEKEFSLNKKIYELLFNGIKNGLKDFYDQKEQSKWPFINYPTAKITHPWVRIVCINNAIIQLVKENPELGIRWDIESIGSYQYIILTLEKENIKMTISSVENAGDLPNESEYRADLAIGNDRLNPQQTLFEISFDKSLPKALTLTYNGKNGATPEFVRLGATTSNQDMWIYQLDIVEAIHTITSETQQEESSVSALPFKEDVQKPTVKLKVDIQSDTDEEDIPLPFKKKREDEAK